MSDGQVTTTVMRKSRQIDEVYASVAEAKKAGQLFRFWQPTGTMKENNLIEAQLELDGFIVTRCDYAYWIVWSTVCLDDRGRLLCQQCKKRGINKNIWSKGREEPFPVCYQCSWP